MYSISSHILNSSSPAMGAASVSEFGTNNNNEIRISNTGCSQLVHVASSHNIENILVAAATK